MNTSKSAKNLPYSGVRIIEFSHMVMGPTCGMILADLGAEVIKVEPLEGDKTRYLMGSGSGFYNMFNRNKKCIELDLNSVLGREIALKLIAQSDILIENFKPEKMQSLGLDYKTLSALHPALIYVSHKGFLPGPYDHRTALDEVVQMMGGLAYMTGPLGRPLRAGTSVNDIMGGMFGALGAMAALKQREISGLGQEVQSSLFENNVLLMGQHMMQFAVTGEPAKPMPERISAWGIYDIFNFKDSEQLFLAVVSDSQWRIFCQSFQFADLAQAQHLRTNNDRVKNRSTLIPLLQKRLETLSASHVAKLFEDNALPFAPITKPEQLFDDPHLQQTQGLAYIEIADGVNQGKLTQAPLLPITLAGERLPARLNPPKRGQHSQELLLSLGYTQAEIDEMNQNNVIYIA
jgi:crotonobetainyl-CoA:carnitine CoA-transferase CaiB-like acyl-CoA transferase